MVKIENINFSIARFCFPSKIEIQRQIDGKRKGTSMKDYIFCKNCLSRDYDAIIANVNKCSICGSTNIENIYLRDEEDL